MKTDLPKQYDFTNVEDFHYNRWVAGGYFRGEIRPDKKPFSISMPPPNITGQLHMGHALNNTLQDILIRYKKMRGYAVLWLPGCDHASISTELKIVEALLKEGLTKEQIGREAFLKRAWAWKETYGGKILSQLKKLGCACDWSRERFTMDETLSAAVTHVFVSLYEKGLVYRGERLINWCPKCKTTISDAEVNHVEKKGFLWHLTYKTTSGEALTFATTRPETLLGDTALAVNPNDARYARFVGKTAVIPLINREIPIIADEYVDMAYGTGVVKITPAHDHNDYAVAQRHSLPAINILNDDGTMSENAAGFAGQAVSECREGLVEAFKQIGQYVKTEETLHSVGVHERCGATVEPLIKKQWFVKMEDLAKPAIAVYENGEFRVYPKRFGKIYLNWLRNIKDWCISRQLWWGHKIPAYYCGDCGFISVKEAAPEKCEKCGSENLTPDADVLDTWFSSALWPFSTLGWPNKTPDYDYFYPTSVLVTAYDILFFWVIRMVFSGLCHTGRLPFKDCLFHGIVRDENGVKMSKSLGNGIDPLDVVENYGADALRLSLIIGGGPGSDTRLSYDKLKASRNFLNKIYNASRFVLSQEGPGPDCEKTFENVDKWIISKTNALVAGVTQNLENYETGLAASKIYAFFWDEFCDWYIEMIKPRLYGENAASKAGAACAVTDVLTVLLKLLHPVAPFITEEIFLKLRPDKPSITLEPWPEYEKSREHAFEEAFVDACKEIVSAVRNTRAELGVAPGKKISVTVKPHSAEFARELAKDAYCIKNLMGAGELSVTQNFDETSPCVTHTLPSSTVYMPLAGLVDAEKENARLRGEAEKLASEIARARQKLENPNFTQKAPARVVKEEAEKLAKYENMLKETRKRLL